MWTRSSLVERPAKAELLVPGGRLTPHRFLQQFYRFAFAFILSAELIQISELLPNPQVAGLDPRFFNDALLRAAATGAWTG